MAMDLNEAMAAILLGNDEKMKENLKVLLQAKTDAEAALAAAHAAQDRADQTLADAEKVRQQGLDALKAADDRKAALDAREAELGRTNDAITAEKVKFEQVRTAVTGQQDQRETILKQREAACDDLEPKLNARDDAVTKRETDVNNNLAGLARKHKRLADAISQNEAE